MWSNDEGSTRERALDHALWGRSVDFVVHELKTPLTSILLSAEDLLDSDGAPNRRSLERILNCARAMQCFVGDLLDSSALDEGQLSLQLAAHPIEPIVGEAFDVVTPLASDRSVALVMSASPTAIAWCDRRRALQVLLNLISNAVRFAKEGGVVAVRATVAHGRVDIAITDDGAGIPAALERQLFEPFAHSTDARKAGHGLGLFISRRIAKALDGEVSLEPNHGAGSTFHFTLPLSPKVAP